MLFFKKIHAIVLIQLALLYEYIKSVIIRRYNSAVDLLKIYASRKIRRSFGEIVLNEGGPLHMVSFVKSQQIGLESWD